jgi:hypothetical protein
MPLTHEEILALKKELDERYDNRYVQISDCNDIQEKNTKRFSNDDKRIEIISHDFGTMKKLLWAVASASIGSLVVAFFELVLK